MYRDDNLIIVTKTEWLERIQDLIDKNVKVSAAYIQAKKDAVMNEEVAKAKYLTGLIEEYGEIHVYNRGIKERSDFEDGYLIYATDLHGLPTIIPTLKRTYDDTYDPDGRIKWPTYMV